MQGGLGRENPSAPMADIIRRGATVMLKPNWVLHYNQSGRGMDCMVTHPQFIEAVLREVLAAQPARVLIGDAPVQGCVFDELVNAEWADKIQALGGPIPIEIIDLRNAVRWNSRVHSNVRRADRSLRFDFGQNSLLEPISGVEGRFRVTEYDPRQLARGHGAGKHEYLFSREPFEVDVFINLPKLKTHKKAGVTAALKNLVGINGDKNYLPHHRLGGSAQGGDCYEGFDRIKWIVEQVLDTANRRTNTIVYQPLRLAARLFLELDSLMGGDRDVEGGWHGNDTVWRMVLDLNRIFVYGRLDGSLANTRCRRVYSITDGIVAGDMNGPLAPSPVNLGVVTFASSSVFADMVHTALMRFDWNKTPLVRNAFSLDCYPLVERKPEELCVHAQGRTWSLNDVAQRWGMNFLPPDGWVNKIELPPASH